MAGNTPASLVGRAKELDSARRSIRDADAGRASTVLIDGEGGIGKTAFVDALTREATAWTLLAGRAHPFDATKPFGVLMDALESLVMPSDGRYREVHRLLTQAGPDAVDVRHRVIDAIIGIIEAEATRRPVMLVLEDLHWADESTLTAIRGIVRDVAHVPVCTLVTMRPSPTSDVLEQLTDEIVASGGTRIGLEPLSEGDVEMLVRSHVGDATDERLLTLVARAGGNPLFVVEVLRSLATPGEINARLPESLIEIVTRQLRFLPQATVDLLQMASILGDTVSINDLATFTRRPAMELIPALSEALRAQLLGERDDELTFRHQLVHDAIYESIPRPMRTALHRDAAGALARSGADPSRVATHLVRGAQAGDLEAVRWLREAARNTAPRAPSIAVDLLRHARGLVPVGYPDADLVDAELVGALVRAGNISDAAALASAVLARPHRDEVDVPIRLLLLESLSLQNRAVDLIRGADEAMSRALSDRESALVLAQASYGRTFSGDYVGGEEVSKRALDVAERTGDAAMIAWSLTTMSVAVKTQGRYGAALDLTRRAVAMASDSGQIDVRLRHPHFFHAMALADADLLEAARTEYAKAIDECADLGSAWILPDALLSAAELRFVLGEWDDAVAELDSGLRVAGERGHRVLVPTAHGCSAVMSLARGDHDAAARTLNAVANEMHVAVPGYGVEMVAYASAMLAEASGRVGRAHELLSRFWRLDRARENRYYYRYLAPALVRIALVLEDKAVAREVVADVEHSAALAPEVPSVEAIALRCRGMVDRDPDAMTCALDRLREVGRVVDLTAACEEGAGVLAAAGRREEAKGVLLEARAVYDSIGADAWALRTNSTLRALGVRTGARGPRDRPSTGWASLTETERAVAALVAEGLTNREAARRLHVSPHTVNTHLRHLFQKLGVSNRAGLATAVAEQRENRAIE